MDVISYEGKTMAVPFDNHGWVQYVNTKVIKEAGLDPENLPTNDTEFIDFALKVTTDEAGKHANESAVYLSQMKALLKRHPKASVIWAHTGSAVLSIPCRFRPRPNYKIATRWISSRQDHNSVSSSWTVNIPGTDSLRSLPNL